MSRNKLAIVGVDGAGVTSLSLSIYFNNDDFYSVYGRTISEYAHRIKDMNYGVGLAHPSTLEQTNLLHQQSYNGMLWNISKQTIQTDAYNFQIKREIKKISDSNVYIVVYDMFKALEDFEHVKKAFQIASLLQKPSAKIYVVGNKMDLISKKDYQGLKEKVEAIYYDSTDPVIIENIGELHTISTEQNSGIHDLMMKISMTRSPYRKPTKPRR